jgi:peptidoglycan/LPS O-acetylase OafA/YrhL
VKKVGSHGGTSALHYCQFADGQDPCAKSHPCSPDVIKKQMNIRSVKKGNDGKRILELDGLRAFAILAVFVYHVWGLPLSWMGVDIFFVLSGFLITGILLERKLKPGYFSRFYGRRARRILVPYYLLLVLSSVLFNTAWVKQWYWYVLFASNVPSAFHSVTHQSLDVLWSLAVEEQFYLIWPMAVLLLSETALVWMALMLIGLAPLLRGLATSLVSSSAPIYNLMPFRMDLLAAGALVAILFRRSPAKIRELPWLGPMLVACAGGALFSLSGVPSFRTSANSQFKNVVLFSFTLSIAVGLLLWALQGKGFFPAILRLRVLRFVGRISYSMYLVHVCFIVLAERWFSSRWAVFAGALGATLVYSTVSWFVIEKRLLHRTSGKSVRHDVTVKSLPERSKKADDEVAVIEQCA